MRTDGPRAAVTVLLTDAADISKEAGRTALREPAVSVEVQRQVRGALAMVSDALSLVMFCPREPVPGRVTELEDGTLQRRDADAPELPEALNSGPDAVGGDPA